MPPNYDLWITARCAEEDLNLPEWPDPDGVTGPEHPALEKFAEQRTEDPEPRDDAIGETHHQLHKLRVGQDRGATWYDRDTGCVFLVAFRFHRSGESTDFYRRVPAEWAAGKLAPTDVDYEQLAIWRANKWFRELRDEFGPALLAEAQQEAREGAVSEILHDLEYCVLRVKARVADDGSIKFRLRIDQVSGRPFLHPGRAALIAMAIAHHTGRELVSVWEWDGEALPYDDLAFEF